MAKSDLRVWAVKGAEQRLVEIAEEAKAIFATFPELRAQGRGFTSAGRGGAPGARAERKEGKTRGRPKRTMSPEARKRIGDAQRARWAKHKASQGGVKASARKTAAFSAHSAGAPRPRKKK